MPLAIMPVLLGLAILVTLGSALYLMLNARALALLFNKPGNELAPGPGRRPPSRGRMRAAFALFVAGTIACVLIYAFAVSGVATDVIETPPEQV